MRQLNTLRPRQNGPHFPDDIFNCIFLNENVWIKNSLKFVPKGPINNIPSLVQITVWRWPDDKPLSKAMLVSLLTHICLTRPQWDLMHKIRNSGALTMELLFCIKPSSSYLATDSLTLHHLNLVPWNCHQDRWLCSGRHQFDRYGRPSCCHWSFHRDHRCGWNIWQGFQGTTCSYRYLSYLSDTSPPVRNLKEGFKHYSDVIMSTMASQITSLMIFTQPFIQVQIKENIKDPRHWPLCVCGVCVCVTGDRCISRAKGQ